MWLVNDITQKWWLRLPDEWLLRLHDEWWLTLRDQWWMRLLDELYLEMNGEWHYLNSEWLKMEERVTKIQLSSYLVLYFMVLAYVLGGTL